VPEALRRIYLTATHFVVTLGKFGPLRETNSGAQNRLVDYASYLQALPELRR
jgi:hypothetical protein